MQIKKLIKDDYVEPFVGRPRIVIAEAAGAVKLIITASKYQLGL